MRLIDKDEFDRCLAEAQSECKKNGGNFRYGVLNQVRGNLAEQPTIHAIPVGWLEWRIMSAKYNGIKEAADAFEFVFNCWKEEQEAKT